VFAGGKSANLKKRFNPNNLMYVKLFNQILDSSIAKNPKLRHFFIDLLLCSDPDGNVIMTKDAIAQRIRCSIEEVEWGIKELEKPEDGSLSLTEGGRRIIPLEGHGYGWKVVNYTLYRDYKTAKQMRDATAERVRRCREKKKTSNWRPPMAKKPGEIAAENE
jgi:hypothetical protein